MKIPDERIQNGFYWGKAWKVVDGCQKVSTGCDNCWSERETNRRQYHDNPKVSGPAFSVMSNKDKQEHRFSGIIQMRGDNLDIPLRTQKPSVYALWNDLYHPDVTDEFKDRVYAVMALCQHHTFLVLTKRPDDMADYFKSGWKCLSFRWAEGSMNVLPNKVWADPDSVFDYVHGCDWPLSNVWHGTTTESQDLIDLRLPDLMQVPGKKFLSIEPMLGPIDIKKALQTLNDNGFDHNAYWGATISAVILGGESGKDARPMHPDWVRNVRNYCLESHTPFFFKQWGEFGLGSSNTKPNSIIFPDGLVSDFNQDVLKTIAQNRGNDYVGKGSTISRVGKQLAGRRIDGELHLDLPWN